jgi:NTE family protein
MKKFVMILICLLTIGAASAEEKSQRKKVAVVLSGGGAKGVAHVGVLKVLEKAGIPIDIITGTSMGSIVGGLYAIGYNAHSLDSVVRNQDWTYVITDRENLKNQSLNDRKKQSTYIISTGMTSIKRNKNAGGIITGKNIAELFDKLCVGYTDSLDFSRDLPIPFACVATDIIHYEEYDFHSGRLPQAMRASMAIPAVFSPVRLNGKVLVDGGMRNNYPVDIAREMGADIVIGVSVHDHPLTYDDVWGTMSVLSQIIDANCKNKFEENKANTDLFMYVDPDGYSAASFSAAAIDTLILRGENEAMRHWDEIIALKKRIGIDDSFKPTILHPLRPEVMTEKQKITGCEFINMTPQDERFLNQKFHLEKLDSIHATLEQEITTSMRIDLFYQTAECRVVPGSQGNVLKLIAGNRKRSQFHAGARYDTEEYAAVQLGLDIPMKTSVPVNTDFTLRLGKRMMARGELTIHPLSFTRPTISYTFNRNDIDIYTNGDRDYNILYNQFQAEITPINFNLRHFNLQMGVRWDYMHYRNKLGSQSSMQVALENEHFYSYRGRMDYNSEDNWYFPTRGARFKAEYAYLTDNFAKLENKIGMSEVNANWRKSFTFGSRFTLQPMFYGRILLGTIVPPVLGNTIGGEWFGHYVEQQMPFAGIGNMEHVDKQFLAAQLQAQQRMGTNHYLLFRLAAGQQADHLKNLKDRSPLIGSQIAYYYNTLLGPAGATIGYSNHTKQVYFYLNLGYDF